MQGFSGKILPEGLEIFPENRRLDLAFPLKSRNYLCAQNENDYLMRLTERRKNGGKRKWRQIGKKKTSERNRPMHKSPWMTITPF